jgi:GTPase SAR1 family protein
MQEMNSMMLPYSQLDWIMSEELKHDYITEGGDLVEILNAKVKFTVLAGAKMQTRRNMAQGLPMLTQFLANPSVIEQLALENKKVDVNEICRMWFEASEFKNQNDVIIDMTPEDQQRQQQKSQNGAAQQKFQQQQALLQQKAAAAEQLADSENVARAARDVLREGFKKSVEPEMLTGQPQTSGSGFGGNL